MNRSFSAVRGVLALLVMFAALGPSAWAVGSKPYITPLSGKTTTSIPFEWDYVGSTDDLWKADVIYRVDYTGNWMTWDTVFYGSPEDWNTEVTGLSIGHDYEFVVSATFVDWDNGGAFVGYASEVWEIPVLPHAPDLLAAELNPWNTVDLLWDTDDPEGFPGLFEVQRCSTDLTDMDEPDDEEFVNDWLYATDTFTGEAFFDMEEEGDELKNHWFRVMAYNWWWEECETPTAVPVALELFSPSSFNGERVNSTTVKLTWYDNSFRNTSYVIERVNNLAMWEFPEFITTYTPSDTDHSQGAMTFYDTSAPRQIGLTLQHYFYRIHAYRADGDYTSHTVGDIWIMPGE